jgi:molybdopterin converting factor small subunit
MDRMDTPLTVASIVLHGRLADLLGREIAVRAPARCSIADLRRLIADERPAAAEAILSPRVRACVGDGIVPDSFRPGPGETVEFLPPVSGG